MTSTFTTGPGAIERAAARLDQARRSRMPCAPVRDLIGRNDAAAAYAVQQELNTARVADGARVVGHKIGLTSAVVQRQLGVDRPDFGVLFDDMAYASGDAIPVERFLQPRVEAEVAFVLGADLADDHLTLDRVRSAIDHAVAALEIVDSRVAGWDIAFADTVADNASSGAFVLGADRHRLDDFRPARVHMTLSVNGTVASVGNGAACLGDPVLAVLWLARTVRDLGTPLRRGDLVLSGALGPMVDVGPGTEVVADVHPLGRVSATFEAGAR